jgi:hypothetical protein
MRIAIDSFRRADVSAAGDLREVFDEFCAPGPARAVARRPDVKPQPK